MGHDPRAPYILAAFGVAGLLAVIGIIGLIVSAFHKKDDGATATTLGPLRVGSSTAGVLRAEPADRGSRHRHGRRCRTSPGALGAACTLAGAPTSSLPARWSRAASRRASSARASRSASRPARRKGSPSRSTRRPPSPRRRSARTAPGRFVASSPSRAPQGSRPLRTWICHATSLAAAHGPGPAPVRPRFRRRRPRLGPVQIERGRSPLDARRRRSGRGHPRGAARSRPRGRRLGDRLPPRIDDLRGGRRGAERRSPPKGPLVKVAGLGPQVGSPTVAAQDGAVLVAWADRAQSSEPWSLRWMRFAPGDATVDPKAFVPSGGGLGEHAMSPTLAAAGQGRFVMAWTEGPVSNHQVRAQTHQRLGDAARERDGDQRQRRERGPGAARDPSRRPRRRRLPRVVGHGTRRRATKFSRHR